MKFKCKYEYMDILRHYWCMVDNEKRCEFDKKQNPETCPILKDHEIRRKKFIKEAIEFGNEIEKEQMIEELNKLDINKMMKYKDYINDIPHDELYFIEFMIKLRIKKMK